MAHGGSSINAAQTPLLKYSKCLITACDPVKRSQYAAGYDLRSAEKCEVPAHGKAIIETGLMVQLPEGCYGRIAIRSKLAAKNFLSVSAGVIDADYRGLIRILLFNHGTQPFVVNIGDRIAQLVCEKICYPELKEVPFQSISYNTSRGTHGLSKLDLCDKTLNGRADSGVDIDTAENAEDKAAVNAQRLPV